MCFSISRRSAIAYDIDKGIVCLGRSEELAVLGRAIPSALEHGLPVDLGNDL